MNKIFFARGGALLLALALLSNCSQPLTTREKGTLVGGGIGGATGAIIGAAVGNLGAGAGALVGDRLQQRDQQLAEQQQQVDQQRQEIARNQQLIDELKKKNLEARETERGVVVNLPDVLFEFGKADLTGDARMKVRNISEVLDNQAKNRRVSVEGHTDSIGSDAYNQQLSERRAENVAGALEKDGVSAQRVTVKGYGKRYPVAPNTSPDGADNPAGRAKNRRVEVVIEN